MKRLRKIFVMSLAVSIAACARSQATRAAGLVGRPLFLRGFWMADKLEFDAAGKMLGRSATGPVSLSGVEVESATEDRGELRLKGHRVALVPAQDGRGLARREIESTTRIAFSMRRGDKRNFHAFEEMEIRIGADGAGGYEQALRVIFADGLKELATSVPIYWECYAAHYFVPDQVSETAEAQTERCVVTPRFTDGAAEDAGAGVTQPPALLSSARAELPGVAAELGVRGTALVHLRIGEDGVPVGLQIVRALGAGVDEAVLQAVAQYRFRPAMRDGKTVAVNMTMRVQVGSGG